MKILHTVEFYSPSVGGSQEVVRQISQHLAARGHEVTVATSRMSEPRELPLDGVAIEEFEVHGNAVRGIEGETDRYQEFLRLGDFDVMLNYGAQQWATDLALAVLDELPYARVLAPCGFSGLFLREYADYFERLPDSLAQYDRIVLHSGGYRDAQFVQSHCPDRARVIPNGAAGEEFEVVSPGSFRERYGIPEGVPLLLTVGSHTQIKGHDLILQAFGRIRAPRAFLVLVGNTFHRLGCRPACVVRASAVRGRSFGRKRVLLLDPPRDEVLEAYAAADLFLLGSRVECSPLVLFEAAASGTPFVSVPAGNAEEIASWTGAGLAITGTTDRKGYVDADPTELARVVDELIEDPQRRAELSAAGRRTWQERFKWDTIAESYAAIYEEAVAERRARSAGAKR